MNEIAKAQTVERADTPTSVMTIIERVALDPNIDVSKMQALLDMQMQIMAKQSEDAFNLALNDAQAEIAAHPVIRNRRNTQTNSDYADLQAVNNVAVPILTKHGLNLSFSPGESKVPGEIWLDYTMSGHGHTRRGGLPMPIDSTGIAGKVNKTEIHARKSAYTYAQRTLVCLICNIATQDDDGNAAGAPIEYVTEKQVADLEALMTEVGADKAGFLRYLKISKLEDLPARAYAVAVQALEAKRKKA